MTMGWRKKPYLLQKWETIREIFRLGGMKRSSECKSCMCCLLAKTAVRLTAVFVLIDCKNIT